jgi:uncharacterized protein
VVGLRPVVYAQKNIEWIISKVINIKLPSDSGQPAATPPAFHIMTKPRGAICNLDCKYCYFLSKERLYPDSDFRMSDEALENYVRQYIAAQRVPEVTFAWQGGEPTLMGLDFYRRAVRLQEKYRRPGMKIYNTLQTNGLQIDDEWAGFFKKRNFLIGVSLDGPEKLHDTYRVDKGGRPTQRRVLAGIERLKKHQVEFNILTCVHAANGDHPLAVYRFLRDEVGARYIQFIPIVERANRTGFQEGEKVTRRSVAPRQYGRFLVQIFDEWLRRDVGQVFVQLFDVTLGVWSGYRAGLCIFEETCGTALALEHNGDLYSCDHFVEPKHFLGDIGDKEMIPLVASEKQQQFGLAKRETLPGYCRQCNVRFMCNGGCPKERFIKTPDGEAGLNYLCRGYKLFFNHIDQPMRMMANLLQMGRSPAEVMTILAGKSERSEQPGT